MATDKELKYNIKVNTIGDDAIKKLGKDIAGLSTATKAFGVAQAKQSKAGLAGTKKINTEIAKTQTLYAKLKTVSVAAIGKMATAQGKLIAKANLLTAALQRSQNGMTFGQQLVGAKEAVLAMAGLVYGVVNAYKAFADFQQRLGEVNTLLNLTTEGIQSLGSEIVSLSRIIPQSAAELTAAEYDIISAGVALKDSVYVLELSAKAAVAGVTDTKTAVVAGVGAINAYGASMSELGGYYDILFQTVKLGVTTFPELSSAIGNVLPIARAAGVDFQTVGAAIASMTKAGIKTPIAVNALRGAINALSAPTKEAKEKMDALGITWQGLIPTLEAIAEQGLAVDQMRELIPDVEARVAVLSLSQNIDGLKDSLNSMSKATGATKAAYDIMAETPENQVKLLGNEITALKIQLGGLVAEGLIPATGKLRELAAIMRELPASTKVIVGLFAAASAGAFLWAAGLGKVIIAFAGLLLPVIKLSAAMMTFSGTLASMAIASTTAAVAMTVLLGLLAAAGIAAIGYAAYKFIEARQAAKDLAQVISDLNIQVDDLVKSFKGFKDVKLPSNITGSTVQEIIVFRDELAKARAYWTALEAQLNVQASQTGLFGTLTDDAKAAVRELPAVSQRLREVQAAIQSLQQGQSEGIVANTITVAIPDIGEVQKYIDDEKSLLSDRISEIEELAVEEQSVGTETAQAIYDARAESAGKTMELVALGLDYALEAYGAESKEFTSMMAQATETQTEFEALRNEALATYETALEKLRTSEQKWATFIEGLKQELEDVNSSLDSNEEQRESARARAEELRYAAREEAEKNTEESNKAAMEMLRASVRIEKEHSGELKDESGKILEDEKKAQKLAADGIEASIIAAEDIGEEYSRAQAKIAAEAKQNYDDANKAIETSKSKIADVNTEANKLNEEKELKVTLSPTYEKLIERFKDLTKAETKTITIQTLETHATGGIAGSMFTRKAGKIPGAGTTDDVPAMLMRGEYVIRKSAVDHFGQGFLDGINNMIYSPGVLPKFAVGGYVDLPLDRKIERAEKTIRELQLRLLSVSAFEPEIAQRSISLMPQGLNFDGLNRDNPEGALQTMTDATSRLSAFKAVTNGELASGVTAAMGRGDWDVAEILETERDAIKRLIRDIYDTIRDLTKDFRRIMAIARTEESELRRDLKTELRTIKAELKEKEREEQMRQIDIIDNVARMQKSDENEYDQTGMSKNTVESAFRGDTPPEGLEEMPSAKKIPYESEYRVVKTLDSTIYYYTASSSKGSIGKRQGDIAGYVQRVNGWEVERAGYIPAGNQSGNTITETDYGVFYNPDVTDIGRQEFKDSRNTVKIAQKAARRENMQAQDLFNYENAYIENERREGVDDIKIEAAPAVNDYASELSLLKQELINEALVSKYELSQDIKKAEEDREDLLDEYEMERLKWIEADAALRAGNSSSQQTTSTSYFATGGKVTGPEGTDKVPAMLTNGEFVMQKKAVNSIGLGFLNQLNNLKMPDFGGVKGYADGGVVAAGAEPAGPPLGTINIKVGESTLPAHVDKNMARQFIREMKLAGMTV